MKKIIYVLLFVSSLLSIVSLNNKNEDNLIESYNIIELGENIERIELADGSYILIILNNNTQKLHSNSSLNSNISGTKAAVGHNKNGSVLWEFRINGTFDINYGLSATATSSNYSFTLNNKQWHFSDGWSGYSLNVAEAKGVIKHKVLLLTLKTVNVHLSLNADIYGNIK